MPGKESEFIKGSLERPKKKQMTASEQLRVRHGKLSERNICELLFFAYTTGMDGSVACSYQGITKTIRFKSGKLLEAKSNDPQDSSAWILYEMGKMDEGFSRDETNKITQSGNTMRLLAEQIQKGFLQPNEIDEFVHRRVRRILHDLMSWRDGDYLLELSKIPRSEPPLKVLRSIPEMLMREIKTAPDPVGLKELLDDPSILIEPVNTGNDINQEIKLTAIEQRLLKAVKKTQSMRDIAVSQGMGLEAASRIFLGLSSLSLVRIRFIKKVKPAPPGSSESKKFGEEDLIPTNKNKVFSPPKLPPANNTQEEDNHNGLKTDENIDNFHARLDHIGSESEAVPFLMDYLNLALRWDPFILLGVTTHTPPEQIDEEYHKITLKLSALKKLVSRQNAMYISALQSLLEEARTILLNITLRKRFDTIYHIVDVGKKMRIAVQEHKKGIQAFKDKRLPLATVHIKFSLFLDPRNTDYNYKLIYMMAQNPRLLPFARIYQKHCLDNYGTNAHIVALSGLLYHRTGDKINARLEYSRALKMDIEHTIARQGLALLDRIQGR